MRAPELSTVEIATGVVTGADPTFELLPRRVTRSPRECLEEAFVPWLQMEPCCVSFSGGRDSSAVLAVATHVARKRGLADPVPVSLRFPDVPEAEESEWQELVVRHLRLEHWERVEVHGELDFLGPVATDLIKRHGLLWPANVHTQAHVVRRVRPRALLTGLEGDGLLGSWRWGQVAAELTDRDRLNLRHIALLLYANGPGVVRRSRMKRKGLLESPWLTKEADHETGLRWMRHEAEEPGRWCARVRWWSRRRYLSLVTRSLDVIGKSHDAKIGHPLLDRSFLAALSNVRPITGFGDRTNAMRYLFGDLLPDPALSRSTKAWFSAAYWGVEARSFAREWDGWGIDPELVDAARLKRVWSDDRPSSRTALLLQSLWALRTASSSPANTI